ncbi:astacin-like metalloprotease toxin 5 [Etheostoma spectabile]|uniref:astacin-like metalloprotease toxin 5 n=1 Tax=Etheostoma spectabile TaxID=54343 RepID=UPI0013AF82C7|nr:astacin-like metalloprotease toxin 5 [Etheostoma spectabile]
MLHLVLAALLLAESSTNADAGPAPGAPKDGVRVLRLQTEYVYSGYEDDVSYCYSVQTGTCYSGHRQVYAGTDGVRVLGTDGYPVQTEYVYSGYVYSGYGRSTCTQTFNQADVQQRCRHGGRHGVDGDDRNAGDSIWPTADIPYEIHPDLAGRTHDILAALAMLSNPTCLSFHKRTSESNYLLFEVSAGCASYVGFIGGVQSVFIGPACTVGNIAHELLHALGFYHEHTRVDRDKYIIISPNNVMQGMQKNFNMQRGKTFELGYDVGSIMHYGR